MWYMFLALISLWEWPMYGHNLHNTHLQEGRGVMSSAVIKWSYAGGYIENAPALVDIKKDGYLEVIVGNYGNSRLYVFGYDGSLFWSYHTGVDLMATPAVADIDGDGWDEIMVGSGSDKLYAINHDGTLLWSYGTGWNITSSPAVCDIDGDGEYEVMFGSWDSCFYAVNHDGTLFWSYRTAGEIRTSSSAVCDIDGDGEYEVMFGSWDYYFYAINHNGTLLWSYKTGGQISSSPVVCDIDGDGEYEVMFGSYDSYFYVLNHDGTVLWSYGTPSSMQECHPGLADIDGDGEYEIIFGTYSTDQKLYVLNHDGTLLWSYILGGKVHRAPAIADIDGDGEYEIVCPNIQSSGASDLYCFNHDGTVCWTITLQRDIHDVAIGDIDNDGCLEIALGTYDGGYLYVLDDPYDSTGCNSVGVSEDRELKIKDLEWNVVNREMNFSIPKAGYVELNLYDIVGRKVESLISKHLKKGSHSIKLQVAGYRLQTGIYFVVLKHGERKISEKIVVF